MKFFSGFRPSLTTLIICLCLGSLILAPILGAPGQLTPELFELETENSETFDASEGDDDLSLVTSLGAIHTNRVVSKSRALRLDFQSIPISIVLPPPKHS